MGNMPQRIHYPITQEELDGLNLIPGEKSFIDTHQLNRINLPERIRREMIKNLNLIDITSVERKN